MLETIIEKPMTSPPLMRMPSDRSKTTLESNNETPRKSEEDHMDASSGAILDVERRAEKDDAGPPAETRFLVGFDGPNDPGNPKNWTAKRRWGITISMGLMVFTVTFASSIFSVNISVIMEKFDVDLVTATLGVALFVLVRLSYFI
jgi:DHA1 family multidrug resistance protein-like MFS transporter